MTVATFDQPDFTSDTATEYKTSIDASIRVLYEIAANFAPHEAASPNMTIVVDAGKIWDGATYTSKSQQATGTITAPSTNPRIDRVVISTSGTVSVITGSEAASPVAPAITSGTMPVCQVLLQTSTTQITNSMITDERPLLQIDPAFLGSGALASGVTLPATQLTTGALASGVTLPATQLTTGAVPAGVTLPADQLTDGAIPAAVTVSPISYTLTNTLASDTAIQTTSTTICTLSGAIGAVGDTLLVSVGWDVINSTSASTISFSLSPAQGTGSGNFGGTTTGLNNIDSYAASEQKKCTMSGILKITTPGSINFLLIATSTQPSTAKLGNTYLRVSQMRP